MEPTEDQPPSKAAKKTFIPEKYVWKRSYTMVLIANAFYILFFYILMNIFQ